MVNTRPEILKIPQNLWLLAEAWAARVGLYDAVQEVEQLLHILEQDPPIDPYFKNRLCTQIDAGEMLLQECQGKLDELVNIYSGSCNDIHQSRSSCWKQLWRRQLLQLTADLSTYKEKFVGVKERCLRTRSVYLTPTWNRETTQTPRRCTWNQRTSRTSSTEYSSQNLAYLESTIHVVETHARCTTQKVHQV